MSKPKVEVKTLDDLQPDPMNVNKHTVRGHQLVENSIRRRGAFRSVAAAGKGVEQPVVYAGNLTHEKARDAGIKDAIFVHTNGDQLVVVVRDDIEPGSAEAIALGLEDNESTKQSYAPDLDVVAALKVGDNAILGALMEGDKVFNSIVDGMTNQPIDYGKEWEGMPEYNPGEAKAYRSLNIHFQTKDDFDKYISRVGPEFVDQSITEKTKSLWYPRKPESQEGLEFINEP